MMHAQSFCFDHLNLLCFEAVVVVVVVIVA